MKRIASTCLVALALAAPAVAFAEASEYQPRAEATASDYDDALKAINRKDWRKAITSLESAARVDPSNADIQNLLGYSNRKNGNLDAAFKHYDRALQLNPKHLGAHEYVGEAYLMAGKPAKAREHLATLERLCPATCEQRELLKKAIADYEAKPR
ncbi:tetratricopeptide repeat protein [Usitatibacter palustris]|uniref:Uncharacterized protein n=1 Tax=Usitatibacter palustris TaxID=2732487 RepID=A0A6M4H509_9PROT|nr:tetratricopeptide repeat protein [Usitatibacter palustris]QJR13783.1 hypothetical protein DSM104440_00573 [Usitatibacter palustris]